MADLYNRAPIWTDYLPAEWQSTINTSPVINALSGYINRRPADIEGASNKIFGQPGDREAQDRNWLLQQARGPSALERMNPVAQDGVNKLGILANFFGPGARLKLPRSGEAYPLASLDQASRLQRAREFGFDTDTVWYHGSPEGNLKVIEPGVRDPGAWFTTDKTVANSYSRGGNSGLYSVFLRSKNPYVVDSLSKTNFVPAHKGQPLDLWDNVAIVKLARRLGHDSVHFPYGNFSEPGNTMVVFDPTSIRATSARYLPNTLDSVGLFK